MAMCRIFYRLNGVEKVWPIDAHPILDNEETLRAHLKRWLPQAEFIRYKMRRSKAKKYARTLTHA